LEKGASTLNKLSIPAALVAKTIEVLQEGGNRECETVVFWLGKGDVVDEVYRPEQSVAVDYFHLPASSMRSLMDYLKKDRRRILAQVHSHPGQAFHSKADDKWAVIRHQGALSLVLPTFASKTTVGNFFEQAATYSLSAEDKWLEVDTLDVVTINS
jgi:proteasome lid subunit RPN8/RPN11